MGRMRGTVERPEGLRYAPDLLDDAQEAALLQRLASLELGEVRLRGQVARRVVRHYGVDYDYDSARVTPGAPVPSWLDDVRARAAGLLGRGAGDLAEVLVTRYPPGATIGWHRDAIAFDEVVGVSLGSPCLMRFQRGTGDRRRVFEQALEPRSGYVLAGPARTAWQHSIPAVPAERYSLTFRTLRRAVARARATLGPAGQTARAEDRLTGMQRPPAVPPETADWTFVIDKGCTQCGFSAQDVESTGDRLRATIPRWREALGRPDTSERPAPTVWSPLEYACHARDVCRIFRGRLELMLREDSPTFANWDQDATAGDGDGIRRGAAGSVGATGSQEQRVVVHGANLGDLLPARRRAPRPRRDPVDNCHRDLGPCRPTPQGRDDVRKDQIQRAPTGNNPCPASD
jgi:DNA oxidative demethylase